jgi:maleylpyruvate isomerase
VGEGLDPDPTAAVAAALTAAVEAATSRLLSSVMALSDDGARAPSLLNGWSRAHILAHLEYVATASLRMTDDALAGHPTTMYPGGTAEREESVRTGPRTTAMALVDRLERASAALAERWRTVSVDDWATLVVEERLGPIRLGRLVALRLTELEVHHGDLAVGYGPHCWSTEFVRVCLPLRFAWLATHHRDRPGADLTVEGHWLFVGIPDRCSWLVGADEAGVVVRAATPEHSADVVLTGSWTEILAFLLGRQNVNMLGVAGDAHLAGAFKRAFPGP